MGLLICPVCREDLTKQGRGYTCPNNHNFDLAKQGYLNLLLSNKKKSNNPGDNKEMIESRKKFLEEGFYEKISHKINSLTLEFSGEKQHLDILDIGCGEGYYTERLKKSLEKNKKTVNILGIDISKEAVAMASRHYKDIFWGVASAGELPIKNQSLDFITCMFSRIVPEEYFRVLKQGGYLIIASTGEEHLLQMKEVLYKDVKTDFYRPEKHLNDFFQLADTINIKYTELIKGQNNISCLFDMTPYRWRSPREGVEKLRALEELEVTVDINLDIFKRKP